MRTKGGIGEYPAARTAAAFSSPVIEYHPVFNTPLSISNYMHGGTDGHGKYFDDLWLLRVVPCKAVSNSDCAEDAPTEHQPNWDGIPMAVVWEQVTKPVDSNVAACTVG